MLLPPKVLGPVSETATSVTVLGALDGATVQLLVDGAAVGAPAAATGLSTAVGLGGTVLLPGQHVSATQSKGPDTSPPWPFPETVVAAPTSATGLPSVVFLSGLHPCIDWVLVGGTIPGATVQVLHAGHRIGTASAEGSNVSVQVHFATPPAQGDVLEAFQEFAPSVGGILRGPTVTSLPLGPNPPREPAAPSVQAPFECDLAVLVSGLQEGASLVVKHDADELTGYPFVGTPVWATLTRPARGTDQLSARQQTETCGGASGFSPPVGVSPAPHLPTPVIVGPVCPNAVIVRVRNLRPGATVTVFGETQQPGGGAAGAQLGQLRAWATECDLALPADWIHHPQLVANPGKLFLTVFQESCDKGSDTARIAVEPLPGLVGQPGMATPVECARLIAARTLTPGAVVVVTSDQPDWPVLSGPVLVTASSEAIGVHRPLRAHEHVQLQQTGCVAAADSAVTEVVPFTGVPAPVVVAPVRVPRGGVTIRDLQVGARLHVFLNSLVSAVVDVDATEMFVPLPATGPDMAVTAIQVMCARISDESRVERSQLGELELAVTPSPITRTKPTAITVTAVDRETRQPVSGTVRIAGTVVGVTGTAFAFTFPAGPQPGSTVEAKDYVTAGIGWNLVDPPAAPPPPTGMLRLSVVDRTNGALAISSVTWGVWKQQLDGTLTPVASPSGQSVATHPPSKGQYQVRADVWVTDGAGNTALAEFRGNAVVGGVSRLVLVWSDVDLTESFRLFLETQTVFANGFAYQVVTPVVAL